MTKEPVIIGQIVSALGLIGLFYPPITDAITAVGGETAFAGALVVVVGFVSYLVRGRVTPV